MILQNIWRRVVGNVLINISPSIILPILLKPERFHKKCQADLAAVSINGLKTFLVYSLFFLIKLTNQKSLSLSMLTWILVEKNLPIFFVFFTQRTIVIKNTTMEMTILGMYRWTWIWRTTVRRIFAYDGRYAWSQSDAYQVFVICIWRILHMTDQFSWSHWVCHIQVHLY